MNNSSACVNVLNLSEENEKAQTNALLARATMRPLYRSQISKSSSCLDTFLDEKSKHNEKKTNCLSACFKSKVKSLSSSMLNMSRKQRNPNEKSSFLLSSSVAVSTGETLFFPSLF